MIHVIHRRASILTCLLVTLLAIFLVACSSGQSSSNGEAKQSASTDKKQVLIGAMSTSSGHYSFYVNAAEAINKISGNVMATVMETGGGEDNLARLGKGEIDIGHSTNISVFEATNGIGNWKGKEVKDLRFLWTYSFVPTAIVVREDSGITTIKDLEGKKFNPGGRGYTTEAVVMNVLGALGVHPDYFLGSTDDAIRRMTDKEIVGFAKNMAGENVADSAILQIAATTPIRLLSLTEEEVTKVQEKFPHYTLSRIAAGTIPNQQKDVQTVGMSSSGVTTTRLPEDLGYAIFKSIVEGRDIIAAGYPAVKNADFIELTLRSATVPLHAGAIKYMREHGIKIPENLIPPEANK